MRIKVDTEAGVEELEVDLSIQNLTMRESVRLEESLGRETFDALMANKLTEQEMFRPSFLRALLYSKLKTLRPDLELDSFDVDLEELIVELTQEEAEIPKVEEPSRP